MGTFLWTLAVLCFIGSGIATFSIFPLRNNFSRKLGTTFPFIENKIKESNDSELLKDYDQFKTKYRKRRRLSIISLIAFLALTVASTISNIS